MCEPQLKSLVGASPCKKVERMGNRVIRISHVYPPIPCRDFDWCAFRDGEEEGGNYGWGSTEAIAIVNLLELEEEE
jgi:hypothetical protein